MSLRILLGLGSFALVAGLGTAVVMAQADVQDEQPQPVASETEVRQFDADDCPSGYSTGLMGSYAEGGGSLTVEDEIRYMSNIVALDYGSALTPTIIERSDIKVVAQYSNGSRIIAQGDLVVVAANWQMAGLGQCASKVTTDDEGDPQGN